MAVVNEPEYLTPPKYEAKHHVFDVLAIVKAHVPRTEDHLMICGCGEGFTDPVIWAAHLTEQLT